MGDSNPEEWAWVGWTTDDGAHNRERRSDTERFLQFLRVLMARDAGYAEVARAAEPFSAVALSVGAGRAVVHHFPLETQCLLLRGDRSVDADQVVELPIVEGAASFSGDFVLTAWHAAQAVEAFVRGADPRSSVTGWSSREARTSAA